MPILPFINDTKENIETIVKRAKESGTSYIIPMFGVTLRKGSREYFYKALDNDFAGFKRKYQARFGEQYECFSDNYRILSDTFRELTAKMGIETHMQFYQPKVYEQLSIFQ